MFKKEDLSITYILCSYIDFWARKKEFADNSTNSLMHDRFPSVNNKTRNTPTAENPVSITYQGAPSKNFLILLAEGFSSIAMSEIQRCNHGVKCQINDNECQCEFNRINPCFFDERNAFGSAHSPESNFLNLVHHIHTKPFFITGNDVFEPD